MPTTKADYLRFFAPFLKGWREATMGPRPTEAQLLTAYYWGLTRPGIESLATAMAVRDGGYTVRQYLLASGAAGAAHNKQRGHATRGLASYAASGGVDGSPNARVFTLTPTKKGLARLAAGASAPEGEAVAPVKAKAKKAKGKARKAKAVTLTATANATPSLTISEALQVTGEAPQGDAGNASVYASPDQAPID